ncbi:hypothetical protein LCGC14_1960220 [marine sediment metagenome]|uniref:Uncharacterized protein n=1 Tax=marine sediment metagenome TaxID=412755 RepID=A0A0F9G369_9ZZZZ
MRGGYRILVRVIIGGVDMKEPYKSRGLCFLLERCDWWNPPLDMVFDGKQTDYCIRCWEWKK